MIYEKPKLVMALGSSGGYRAFLSVMNDVDPEMMKNGTIYFVDHVGPTGEEIKMYEDAGLDFLGNMVRNREKLKKGTVKFQHDAYGVFEDDRRIKLITKNGKGLNFMNRKASKDYMGLAYSIKSALNSGYGKDMMAVFLSGAGDDGCDVLDDLEKNGSNVIIQEPETAIIDQLPRNIMLRYAYAGGGKVMEPNRIGEEINRFLYSD